MPDCETNVITEFAENETCPAYGYQAVSICVPVEVKPYAKTGKTVTKCCGNPVIKSGKETCTGEKNSTCYFTISQEIVIGVPVEFGADAFVGDHYVDCLGASADDNCPKVEDKAEGYTL